MLVKPVLTSFRYLSWTKTPWNVFKSVASQPPLSKKGCWLCMHVQRIIFPRAFAKALQEPSREPPRRVPHIHRRSAKLFPPTNLDPSGFKADAARVRLSARGIEHAVVGVLRHFLPGLAVHQSHLQLAVAGLVFPIP